MLKKVITGALITVACVATQVNAQSNEEWYVITSAKDGSVLVGKKSSLEVRKSDNMIMVGATFSIFNAPKNTITKYHGVINLESCKEGRGKLYTLNIENDQEELLDWNIQGNKFGDHVAVELCKGALAYFKNKQQSQQLPQQQDSQNLKRLY